MDNIELVLEDIEGIDLSLDTTIKIIKPHLQDKELTINENGTQNITADEGYNGLGQVNVTVNAIEDLTEELDTHDAKLTKQETTIYNIAETLKNKAISSGGGDEMAIYSLEETVIGTWIDGKPIYRKVIDLGNLPDNGTKYVPTGLIHTDIRIVRIDGNATNADGRYQSGLNDFFTRVNTLSDNTLSVNTKADFSDFTGYAILEYTKTTD